MDAVVSHVLNAAREHAFGAFFGKQKFKVKVIFDQVAAPFIREKIWNKSQVVKERGDGGVDFEITVWHCMQGG